MLLGEGPLQGRAGWAEGHVARLRGAGGLPTALHSEKFKTTAKGCRRAIARSSLPTCDSKSVAAATRQTSHTLGSFHWDA